MILWYRFFLLFEEFCCLAGLWVVFIFNKLEYVRSSMPLTEPSITKRQCLWSHFKPLTANLKPQELFLTAGHSILVWTMHVVFFILTCICLGQREWKARCKRGRLSYISLFLVRDCCSGCLEPQQSSIVSFITNRGQLLHPLVDEFLLSCSLEYLFCSRS